MYIVEGNIGVGKSTFLKLVAKNMPNIKVIQEPLENWATQVYGQSLLENFYQAPKRWAYTLETLAMICRAREHLKEQENSSPNFLMERSIYSGHYCFAVNGYESNFFTKIEWEVYNQWVDFLVHTKCKTPKGFIYLKADSQVCFDRIKKRNRSSEKDITIDYIKQIEQKHEEFLVKKSGINKNLLKVPVLILDCNQDFVENKENFNKHIEKLNELIG